MHYLRWNLALNCPRWLELAVLPSARAYMESHKHLTLKQQKYSVKEENSKFLLNPQFLVRASQTERSWRYPSSFLNSASHHCCSWVFGTNWLSRFLRAKAKCRGSFVQLSFLCALPYMCRDNFGELWKRLGQECLNAASYYGQKRSEALKLLNKWNVLSPTQPLFSAGHHQSSHKTSTG